MFLLVAEMTSTFAREEVDEAACHLEQPLRICLIARTP